MARRRRYRPQSIGEFAEEKYWDGIKGVGNFLWKGFKQVLDSNFGKGMLLTAAAVVAGMAVAGPLGIIPGATINQGIVSGLTMVSPINPLSQGGFNLTGIATLLAGGLAGRILLPKGAPDLTARQARKKAEELAEARARQPGMGMQKGKSHPANSWGAHPADGKDEDYWTKQRLAEQTGHGAGVNR